MGLPADIQHQLKVIDEGLAVLKKAEERSSDARSMIKKARERLALLVDQLLSNEQVAPAEQLAQLPPLLPPTPIPLDEGERQEIFKRLRKVGYVPKAKHR